MRIDLNVYDYFSRLQTKREEKNIQTNGWLSRHNRERESGELGRDGEA